MSNNRFTIAFNLFKKTLFFFKLKKSLCFLPLLSVFFSFIVLGVLSVPAIAVFAKTAQAAQTLSSAQSGLLIGLFVLFSFLATIISVFFNTALTACALKLMQRQPCAISDGIKTAFSRIHFIFLWSLIALTVGLILDFIEGASKRFRILEDIVAGLLGAAWSFATLFVLPICIVENSNPTQAIKRSVILIKNTWGQSLIAMGTFGLFFLPLFVIALLPVILGLHFHQSGLALFFDFAATFVLFLIVMVFSSTLNTILRSGLYLFACGDQDIAVYDPESLKNAFRSKITGGSI